ncbi:phytochelatin synthase family protein [Bradyrhizobium sp. WSM2793]|uniref:phytochelatin synthase family protein n=1 Tax=Bradyrhizobium sp. WSM2793 TaxID=1038866 RepID=UPI0006760569|nr:phytochelatin synthase family protein [Bradyrhizobium sp. WSM2793]
MVVTAGLLDAGALVVGQSRVPTEAIVSSVTRTPELIERAWHLPVAATFHRNVNWQSNSSRCGPAAVANAYRSLGEAASTEGKVLRHRAVLDRLMHLGLTLDQLAEVAGTNTSRKVTVLRDLSEDQFLEHLRRSNDPGRRYIVNFNRAQIFGAGVGHHSPIGGYLEAEDLVLVLDVNSSYQPWLVGRRRLFAAVNTYDGDKKRGLLLIE